MGVRLTHLLGVRVQYLRCNILGAAHVLKIRERQAQLLEIYRQYVALSFEEFWLRCFALGGSSTPLEIDAYIHGALRPTRQEFNVIAIALNEYLGYIGVNLFIEYVEEDLDI